MEGIGGLYRHLLLHRLAAAYRTVPIIQFNPVALACIATFAGAVVPVGLTTGFLQFQVEKRVSKWIEASPG